MINWPVVETKQDRRNRGLEEYQRSLRSPVRGLWQGVISESEFADAMLSVIDRGLTRAFQEGAAECGIAADELTQDEQEALAGIVAEEFSHVGDFGAAIVQNSRAAGGQLTPLFTRLELWVNRYRDATNQAKAITCRDSKMIWIIGPTEESCRDCTNYNGRVYRASVWEKNGIRPQHPNLACHGYRCLCQLQPTDAPINKGRPPRMTG